MRSWIQLSLAALVSVSLLCGCAAFLTGMGDSAAGQGDWDAAYNHYHAAAIRDPENLELRAKLERAQREAADMHRTAGQTAQREGRLGHAIGELSASLAYQEDAPTRALLERVREQKRLVDAEIAMSEASRREARRDLEAARHFYAEAASLNPKLEPQAARRIAQIEKQLAKAAALGERARALLAIDDFAAAEHMAQQALAIHAKDPVALDVAAHVQLEHDAAEAVEAALDAEDDREHGRAVELARKAVDARSTPSRVALVERLEDKAFHHFARQGERAFKREDWSEAIRAFEHARRYGPDPDALGGALASARYEHEYELGERAERKRDLGDALAHYRNAYAIRSSESLAARIWTLEHPEPEPKSKG